MKQLEQFITNLAYRFRNENDLSVMTWTLCQTSDLFLESFINFFFPGLCCESISLKREVSEDDSRPDFFFKYNNETYLIECKIYDRQHHFEQYIKRFKIPNNHLGYITNYPLLKSGFEVHTWTELYSYLKKLIPAKESGLWNGYLSYLENVCNIFINESPMNLDGMFSVYTFYRSLDEVFAFDNDRYTSSVYNSKKDTNNGGNFTRSTPRDGVIGKYFGVSFKQVRWKKSWGWMGVYFEREHPLICVGFDSRDGWGKPIYDLLINRCNDIKAGKYYDKPYYDEESNAVWFDFKKDAEFNKLTDCQEQINLLRSFLAEVFDTIYNVKQKTLK